MSSRVATQSIGLSALAVAVGVASTTRPSYAAFATGVLCLLSGAFWFRRSWTIFGLVAVSAVAIAVTQASQGHIGSSWKLSGHAVLLLGFVFLWRYAYKMPQVMKQAAHLGIILAGASALLGAVGGLDGPSVGFIATWQDARWIGAVGVGFAIAKSLGPLALRWTFLWLLMLNASNLVVSVYQLREPDLPHRFGLAIPPGMFGHPTQTSVVGVALLLFVLTEHTLLDRRAQIAAMAIAVIELVLCARFKALIGIGAGIVFVYAMKLGVRASALAAAAAIVPMVITFGLIRLTPPSAQYDTSATSGIATVYGHATSRITLFTAAEALAKKRFPVGSGLGTFGSYLDEERELHTYASVGLGGAYGFRRGEVFVSDNYVAHILAERGLAGLIAWLLSLAAFVYCAIVAAPRCGLFPATTLVAAIAMSPVVPVFRDGTQILILFVPAAMCLWSTVGRVPRPKRLAASINTHPRLLDPSRV
jgi:hypothetical protein